MPKSITVRTVTGEPFERVVDYELGEKPEAVLVEDPEAPGGDSIPF